jgi:hypothetical protein
MSDVQTQRGGATTNGDAPFVPNFSRVAVFCIFILAKFLYF